ncbi:hypothetical protein CNEO3_410028 [Clostridium neonatale]|nr:hypothetical protein CNEO3_410028 [Clostridium neonatale]
MLVIILTSLNKKTPELKSPYLKL